MMGSFGTHEGLLCGCLRRSDSNQQKHFQQPAIFESKGFKRCKEKLNFFLTILVLSDFFAHLWSYKRCMEETVRNETLAIKIIQALLKDLAHLIIKRMSVILLLNVL